MKKELAKPVEFKGAHEMPYCTVSVADTRWNRTGTWRYLRPQYIEQIPACQAACPASEPIERWIALLEKGMVSEAWETLTMENPFPGLMGRICFHPCEKGCNRKDLGGAITINTLEKYLADEAGYSMLPPKPWRTASGKKVAVVGSGPAGLANAYFLTRLGHSVTIYEKFPKPGGLFRYGIPEYRLPKDILDKELKKLFDMGINFQCGKALSKSEIAGLAEKYNAVFIAIGAHISRPLGVEGENVKGVVPALEFLENIQNPPSPPFSKGGLGGIMTVVVVGGGNSAIDAARMAKRLGAGSVTIIYRRSRVEMPAFEEEVNDAEKEGVKFEMLAAPKRIISENGKVTGVECLRMKLGSPDSSGRRAPVPIDGSEFTVKTDLVLAAIGETVDESIFPERPTSNVQRPTFFAGGDCAGETRTVVNAIGSGKLQAIAIDCMLSGKNFKEIFEKIRIQETEYIRMSAYLNTQTLKHLNTAVNTIVRTEHLNTYYFDDSCPDKNGEPKAQLARCMHCGHCIDCDNCFIYCPDIAICKLPPSPPALSHQGRGGVDAYNYDIDYDFCKGCGVCVKECPRAALEMIEEPV